MNEQEKLTAKQVFDELKSHKNEIKFEELRLNKSNLLAKSEKALKNGQTRVAKELLFTIKSINGEIEAFNNGYKTYVNKDLLFEYMVKCDTRSVVLNYLKDFPREIPDDITEKVNKLRELCIFDDFVIVFTDYTGEERSKVDEDRREKDPIIFGIFCDKKERNIYDRFYFIGDWVDEYCDLTLNQLIIEQRNVNPNNPISNTLTEADIKFSEDYEEKIINQLEKSVDIKVKDETSKNKVGIISKILSFFKKWGWYGIK